MEIRLDVSPELLDVNALQEVLKQHARNEGVDFELKLRKPKVNTRVEPTVLVAVVTMTGTALGALIGGLLNIAAKSTERKIAITTKDGTNLEYPADLRPTEVKDLVETLKQLEEPTIRIISQR